MMATFVYFYAIEKYIFVPVAQSDRALASGARGCAFESHRGYCVLTEKCHLAFIFILDFLCRIRISSL